jgi:hypothetical protein
LFHDFRNFVLLMPGCNLALKCAHARLHGVHGTNRKEGRRNVSEAAKGNLEVGKNRKGYADVQGAPRFPIKLPVAFKSAAAAAGVAGPSMIAKSIETENISANGVLFRMDADVPVGSAVDFTISLPADVVGAEADVQVDCRGRVVRSFADGGRRGVGVVIDEYRFERK